MDRRIPPGQQKSLIMELHLPPESAGSHTGFMTAVCPPFFDGWAGNFDDHFPAPGSLLIIDCAYACGE